MKNDLLGNIKQGEEDIHADSANHLAHGPKEQNVSVYTGVHMYTVAQDLELTIKS